MELVAGERLNEDLMIEKLRSKNKIQANNPMSENKPLKKVELPEQDPESEETYAEFIKSQFPKV